MRHGAHCRIGAGGVWLREAGEVLCERVPNARHILQCVRQQHRLRGPCSAFCVTPGAAGSRHPSELHFKPHSKLFWLHDITYPLQEPELARVDKQLCITTSRPLVTEYGDNMKRTCCISAVPTRDMEEAERESGKYWCRPLPAFCMRRPSAARTANVCGATQSPSPSFKYVVVL